MSKDSRSHQNELQKLIKKAAENVSKEFSVKVSLMNQDVTPGKVRGWIPTGSTVLDYAIGEGVPKFKVLELFGPEGRGKTSLSLSIIAQAQKEGTVCIFFDREGGATTPERAENFGVNLEDLTILEPNCLEDFFQISEYYMKFYKDKGIQLLIVLDSLTGLPTKSELEADTSISDFEIFSYDTKGKAWGNTARVLSRGLRQLTASLNEHNTTVLIINQMRQMIETGFHARSYEETPGGRALKYYAHLRLFLTSTPIESKSKSGNACKVLIKKNKVNPVMGMVEFDMYRDGIDDEASVVDFLVKEKILELGKNKKEIKLQIDGKEELFGRRRLINLLKEDPKMKENFRSLVHQYFTSLRKG